MYCISGCGRVVVAFDERLLKKPARLLFSLLVLDVDRAQRSLCVFSLKDSVWTSGLRSTHTHTKTMAGESHPQEKNLYI